jgi:hypothetical protein
VYRPVVLGLATVFLLSACIPLSIPGQPTAAPVVDTGTTDAALAATMAAETLNALPTPTLAPATDTPPPTATQTDSPTATEAAPQTPTADPSATSLMTVTVAGTLSTSTPVNPTATETLHPRFYGTLPPAIPFGKITLVNRAKADVYVSLQCTTVDGHKTIIEYPVFGRLNVSAPAGSYVYVAWVGGRQFQGSFRLGKGEDLAITFNRDKITVQ